MKTRARVLPFAATPSPPPGVALLYFRTKSPPPRGGDGNAGHCPFMFTTRDSFGCYSRLTAWTLLAFAVPASVWVFGVFEASATYFSGWGLEHTTFKAPPPLLYFRSSPPTVVADTPRVAWLTGAAAARRATHHGKGERAPLDRPTAAAFASTAIQQQTRVEQASEERVSPNQRGILVAAGS